jgi:chorismate lyase/3-hydroxybenzoate synthase
MNDSGKSRAASGLERPFAQPPSPPLALARGAGATAAAATAAAGSAGAAGDRALLVARFAGACPEPPAVPFAVPCARVANRALGSTPPVEVWTSGLPAERGRQGRVEWAENGQVLFGSLGTDLVGDLAGESAAHFADLLAAAESRGYPHLLRVWNFLPGINAAENGTERYRLFNAGRAAAFDARYGVAEAETRFSASSAVGSSGAQLVTWFAAARTPGRHLGNPRQVHAFRYPADYGPRPPSFTRATISPPELGEVLFLSGTASIAGHETRHVGELLLQLEETLHNIETLLAAGGDGTPLPGLADFDLLRVYLRDASDLELVRAPLARRVGARPELHFVEADICRADLLLEIEGVAGLPR